MSDFSARIQELVRMGRVRVSEHGFDELTEDGIKTQDAVRGVAEMVLIEEYPEYPKGPCVLVLEKDRDGRPFHVVWGIPKGYTEPVVLITAYRPDPDRWDATFTRRNG
jgi:hypothetical protein